MDGLAEISESGFATGDREDMSTFATSQEAAFELSPDGIVAVRDSMIVAANAAFGRLLGRQTDSIIDGSFESLLTPETISRFKKAAAKVSSGGSPDTVKVSLRHREGHAVPVECSLRSAAVGGEPVLLIFTHDAGPLNLLQQQLKLTTDKLVFFSKWVKKSSGEIIEMNQQLNSEIKLRGMAEKMKDDIDRRFRTIAETIPEVFWMYSHREKKLIYVSPAFEKIYGRPSEEYYRNPDLWREVIHPDDLDAVKESLESFFGTERELEYRILQPDWTIRWIRDRIFPVRDGAGEIIHIVGFCEDITDRKRLEENLRLLSVTDGLTGLFNHQHLFKKLFQEMERSRRIAYPLSLIMFDIDNFKRYNDIHGHLKGDEVLGEVGRVTQQMIRAGVDSAFRYGGDEFVIILPNTGLEGAEALKARLTDTIVGRFPEIGISVGVALMVESQSVEEFIEAVDAAMYHEKDKAPRP
jgi:diguanylate cyclase (GGDEF)-like protein/PAS domain S-box-containing protein